MYTILVNEDHSLITTKRERIMQRSKNVNSLCFLIKPQLNEINVANSTVVFEYVTPVLHKYDTRILTSVSVQEDGYMEFFIPFDLTLTSEPGDLQIQLTFLYIDLDSEGNPVEKSKKTSIAKIKIVPIAAWSDYVPDSGLTAVDQRILKTEAQLKAILEMGELSAADKADNIVYDDEANTIQLMSGTKEIGDLIQLKCSAEIGEDGVPIVNFNTVNSEGGSSETPDVSPDSPTLPDDDDVVEF